MTDNTDIIHVPGEELPAENKQLTTDDLIEMFITETQNLMETSKVRYRKSLRRYFKWLNESGFDIRAITLSELLVYRKYIGGCTTKKGEKLSDFTVNAYLTSLKVFYEWAHAKGIYPINPAKGLKGIKQVSKFKRKPLTAEECKKLLNYYKEKSVRDYAIVNLLIRCGLRVMELTRLDYGDITHEHTVRVIKVQGKGHKEKDRFVQLTDKALIPIETYLKTRKDEIKKDSPVFVSESFIGAGERLIPGTISRLVKKGLNAIGLTGPEYTAHSLRHSSGSAILKAGGTMEQAQTHLRHHSSATTMIYVRAEKEEQDLKNSGTKLIDEMFD